MGSGKSHWGRLLSGKLNLAFFDLDEEITLNQGKSINELFEERTEEHFRLLEKEVLHFITESHDSFVMACGGGAPCFFNNIEYMNRSGTTVWLNTPFEILLNRLTKEKANRPLIKDVPDKKIKSVVFKKLNDRKIYYEQANVILDEEDLDIDNLVEKIFHA